METAEQCARITLFTGSGCPACSKFTRRFLAAWRRQAGDCPPIDCRAVLDHLDAAARAGVLRTPALLVEGKLVCQGYLAPEKAVAAVRRALDKQEESAQ